MEIAVVMEEDWVVLCQASFQSIKEEDWIEMHEKLKDVTRKIGVKEAGQRVVGAGEVGSAEDAERRFLFGQGTASACFSQEICIENVNLEVGINQAMRIFQDRQAL